VNLFHSFGNFNVPNNNIANFLNDSGLSTSNILGRVTGGNLSNIFGTIQTTGFGNANLFLMNPAGFLFGPNATVNVGGMVSFTSADYLRLGDGVRFKAIPNASADALLSVAPVAAFGFLGSHPGAITVQGSHLAVAEGTGISLVGGNITVQGGALTAPSGQINLVSVGKTSNSNAGGEVANGGAFVATGFKSLGAINVSNGSTIDTSAIVGSGHAAGSVSIRGGQLVMDDSSIKAHPATPNLSQINGNIDVTADQVLLSNHSTIDTSTPGFPFSTFTAASTGNISFNVNTFSATDSTISTSGAGFGAGPSGAVAIQGLEGAGTSANSVSLNNTTVVTSNSGVTGVVGNPNGGPILIRADNITLNQTQLSTGAREDLHSGGAISLLSRGSIEVVNSNFITEVFLGGSGSIDLRAGGRIELTNTIIDAHSFFRPGTITLVSPIMSLSGSTLKVYNGNIFPGGSINLTGTKAVSLTNGTVLNADNSFNPQPPVIVAPPTNANGGTILINGGGLFTSRHSTISAQSALGNGGTIHIEANKVRLTDTQVTTSVSGGPQTVGGRITVDAEKTTLTNSQLLSTATEGHGGLIGIASPIFHKNAGSVIDASSQSGTDGTVTINGVIQP